MDRTASPGLIASTPAEAVKIPSFPSSYLIPSAVGCDPPPLKWPPGHIDPPHPTPLPSRDQSPAGGLCTLLPGPRRTKARSAKYKSRRNQHPCPWPVRLALVATGHSSTDACCVCCYLLLPFPTVRLNTKWVEASSALSIVACRKGRLGLICLAKMARSPSHLSRHPYSFLLKANRVASDRVPDMRRRANDGT